MASSHPLPPSCHWFSRLASALDPRSAPRLAWLLTVVSEAKQALLDLADLTETIANGGNPDPHSVLGYQAKLVRYYALAGEEMARQFGAKERSYLARKVTQAKEHIKGRRDLNMTVSVRWGD